MEWRLEAIVLKKREIGETDRIYTFFTKEIGKVSAIAKGVRKSEAKLAAALETGSRSEIVIVRTRGMGKVAGAVLVESLANIREHFTALQSVLEALSIVDRLVEPEEPDLRLYVLLTSYLALATRLTREGLQDKVPMLTEAFLFQVAFQLGYPLQLSASAVSTEPLQKTDRYVVSPSVGGVFLAHEGREVVDGVVIQRDTLKLLRLIQSHPLENILKVVVQPALVIELTRLRRVFLDWIVR